ncbi:MAG: hypothetical protein ABIY37_04285 [Devosia sp.]
MRELHSIFVALALSLVPASAASANDYLGVRVLETIVIEKMPSGPGLSGTVLSPDGESVLHLSGRDICLWKVNATRHWIEIGCATSNPEFDVSPTEDARWSPDSSAVLLPTYSNAFERFRDADIAVFDIATRSINVLTADGLRNIKDVDKGYIDASPQWLDADTIVFVRYLIEEGGLYGTYPIQVMTIERDGTGLVKLTEIERPTRGFVDALASSPDGKRIAYSLASKDDSLTGVWMLDLGETKAVRLVPHAATGEWPRGLSFSPDGEKLLIISSAMGYPNGSVVDLASGEAVDVSAEDISGLGWSPTGHSLIYMTSDRNEKGKAVGVYVAPEPGDRGYRILDGKFFPAACCYLQAMPWASNDRLVFLNPENIGDAFFVQLDR